MAAHERRRSSVVEVQRSNDGILRIDDGSIRRMSQVNPYIADDIADAKQATSKEHELSIPDAIKLYRKGICFSLLFSLAVVMEGYDLALMGSFYGFPPFKNKYGTERDPETGGLLISASWQSGLSNAVQVSH